MDDGRTLVSLFKETVKKYPNKTALIFYGRKFSYEELDQLSDRMAGILNHFGVKKGDRVSFVAPNTPHVPIAFLAVWKIGAVVAAVNPLENSEKILKMINLVEPKKIVILENFNDHLAAISRDYDQSTVIRISVKDYLPCLLRLGYRWKNRKNNYLSFGRSWAELFEFSDGRGLNPLWPPAVRRSSDDLAVLQYTGGTSGGVKAAMLTHANMVANALQSIRKVNEKETLVGPDTVFLGVMPFFHVYGLSVCLTMAFALGATVVLLPKFEPKEVFNTIAKYKVNVFPGIQRMFASLVDYAEAHPGDYAGKLRSLKFCCNGAGKLSEKVRSDFEKLSGKPIFEGYGLSEASPVVSIYFANGEKGKLGTPLPDTEMKADENGVLWIRGPQVMKGYWRNREATEKALPGDGWLRTADIVKHHDDGSWEMIDREGDMMKINGENVYPSEIEAVIAQHGLVAEVAVFGMLDEKSGERAVACVVVKDGYRHGVGPAEITAHCRSNGLSGVRIPKEVVVVKEIPKNIVGKVLKRELREKLMAGALS